MSFKDFLYEIVNSGIGYFTIGSILGYLFIPAVVGILNVLGFLKSDTDNKKDLVVDNIDLKNGMRDLEKFSIK